MLKLDLTLQIMNWTDNFLNDKNKTVIGLIKSELGRKTINKFVRLREKLIAT